MNGKKVALVTGISGQDAFFLSNLLNTKGYTVYGMLRGQDNPRRKDVEINLPFVRIVEGDLLDQSSLFNVISKVKPSEIYNLGAISFVPISWTQPILTVETTGLGVLRLLEAVKTIDPTIKLFQSGSSEQMGKVREVPQTEKTPFYPRSPYGVAKCFGFEIVRNYRESYGLFACSAISYNHESQIRPNVFVTRKITQSAARIKMGLQTELKLGNIESKRDWGYSGDFCLAYWMMLQAHTPDDFIVATNETHSIKEFCEEAFSLVGLDWSKYVKIDSSLIRPAEVDILQGDYSKIRNTLGWEPTIRFKDLVRIMVDYDLGLLENR